MSFVNISNHPSGKWSEEQKNAAEKMGMGEIVDRPFPNIPPDATEREVQKIADEIVKGISQQDAVHVMGEMGCTFKIVRYCISHKIDVYHSTTERIVVEESDGKKTVQFKFVQFRAYNYDTPNTFE